MFLRTLFISVVLLFCSVSYSQSLRHTLGSDVIVIDSNNINDSASLNRVSTSEIKTLTGSQLLSSGAALISPSLDIRSYGSLGGIALATFRGLPAEFVSVEYNGIKLVNTQHSLSDLALIDINLLNTISLNSAPANSGAADNGFGIVRLEGLAFNDRVEYITIGSCITSYNDRFRVAEHNSYLKLVQKISEVFSVSGGISFSGADGKYPFTQVIDKNTSVSILRENNNAQLANVSIDLNYTPASEIALRTFMFYTKADRGIPGANTVSYRGTSSPDATQFDEQYLIGISLDHRPLEYFSYVFKTSFQSLFETYTNPQTKIFDRYTNHNYTLDWESKTHFWEYFDFYGTASFHRYTLISNENIIGNPDSLILRNVYRSNLGLGYQLNNFSVLGYLKTELYTGNDDPQLLPQITLQQLFFPTPEFHIALTTSYTKIYHAPTFNELYWKVGGNQNLLPEEGDAFEISAEAVPEYYSHFNPMLSIKATGFYNALRNQIIWTPGANAIFSPINLLAVRTFGLEMSTELILNKNENIEWRLRGGLTLERTENTNQQSLDYGHELPYSTPRRWNVGLSSRILDIGNLTASLLYRAHRYTNLSNIEQLPEVVLVNVDYTSAPISFFQQCKATISLSINNLFDKQYEEIKSFPLPGRMFRLGVELVRFNEPNNILN